jgi:hypothetical protein
MRYDKPRLVWTRLMINHMTGEPILTARTADQYLARYWTAVRSGKIGSGNAIYINPDRTEPLSGAWHA